MATRRQRSRKHARRVQHVRSQRERLRSALAHATAVPGSMNEVTGLMGERGYEPDATPGKWVRLRRGKRRK